MNGRWTKLIAGTVLGIAAYSLSAIGSIAAAAAPQNVAVVYYTLIHNREEGDDSAVGKTQRVALEIAKQTNSTVLELKNATKYPATYNETLDVARDELDNGAKPEMAAPVDVSSYQDVYVGMPCWWSSYPRVFASWFESQDFAGKNIYVFVTSGGSGFGRIISDMREAIPDANVRPLFDLNDSDVDDYSDEELSAEVREALEEL